MLIVVHDNPDPDCMATALILRKIFEEITGNAATIAYGGVVGRSENRAMMKKLRIPMVQIESVNFSKFELFALVDTQPRTGNNSLPANIVPTMVIDHHPRKAKVNDKVPWLDIRPKFGATATIAYEYAQAAGVQLDRRHMTALFYAVKSETQDLGREGIASDRRAYFDALRHVDPETIFEIVYAPLPREYFKMLFMGLQNAKIYQDTLVTNLLDIDTPEYVAEIADMLLRIEDITWTFVMGRYEGDLYLSIRSLDRTSDAGMVMQKVVARIGSGGGHELVAGGKIPNVKGDEEFLRSLEDALTKIFLRAIRAKCKEGDMLVVGEEESS